MYPIPLGSRQNGKIRSSPKANGPKIGPNSQSRLQRHACLLLVIAQLAATLFIPLIPQI